MLKGLRLAEQHSTSFAAPVWEERIRDDPHGRVDWLVYDQFGELADIVTQRYPGSRVRMRFDDMVAVAGAAEAGLGVVRRRCS